MNSKIPPQPQYSPPDEEPELDWKMYEKAIAHIEDSYNNCKVNQNYRVTGRRSGKERQVDVWLEAEVGDNHVVTIAIECRRYSDRPVSIKDIDAFYGFLDDIGASKGVMISHTGYTEGARERAKGAGIELRMLTLEEAEEFDWDEFIQDSCEVQECFGTINWCFSDGDSEAGYCGNCGSFHIRCGNCETVDWYHEGDVESCPGCKMQWRLKKEKGMTCGIAEILPVDESEDEEEEEDV